MKLSSRLTVAMVGLVVATAVAVGWVTYRNLEAAVLPRAVERLESHVRLLAAELAIYARGARADISGFRSAVALNGIVRAHAAGGIDPLDGTTTEATWRERMAARYVAELESKPAYSQFRIIGIDDGGREIVRVDRRGKDGAIRIVPDAELQTKSDRSYVTDTLRLRPDEIYVSPIELSHDNGLIEVPHVPVLRVAAPIQAPDGKPFGIVIINLDMRPIFSSLRGGVRSEAALYVINDNGDYLVNPDPEREFAFERGPTTKWYDDFPQYAAALGSNDIAARALTVADGERVGIGGAWTRLAGGPRVAVIEVVPGRVLMAAGTIVRDSSLRAGLALVLCAVLLAVIFARSLTKPLVQMTAAVVGFGRGQPMTLPGNAGGEIGVLARAFARMSAEVQEKTAALQDEIEKHRRTEAREQLFGAAVESSNDAVITMTLEGAITGWNPAAERLLGYSAEEAIGRGIEIIAPEDRRAEARDALEKVRRGEKADHFETVGLRKDGKPIDLLVSVSPVKSPGGALVGACKIAHDITGRKRTRSALTREIEERRRIFETSQDLILVTDRKGNYVQVSPSSWAILGYRPEEMVGRSAVDFIYPDDLDPTRNEMRAARRGGLMRNFECRYVHKDGRVVSLTWMGTWSEPAERHFFIGRDMTESRKAQDALLESEQMARGIIDTALDAFVQMDETGTIVDWNSQAEAIFGWPRREAIGRTLGELIIPEKHRERHQQGLAHFLRSGESAILGKRFEIEAQRRDSRLIQIELSVTALRRSSGYVFNGFMRDLTEKVAAEAQIRQAQKMEAVGQLTGGIAHDFNNILTVITGTIEILAEAVADKPQLAAIAQMIDEASERGAGLTQHLLAFARKQPLQPQEIDINALIVETAQLLRPTLGEQVEMESMLEADAWRAMVDPNQLATALLNLSLNARDAMPNGGKLTLETGNVHLDESYATANSDVAPGPYVMIAVSDTGSGIPAAIRDKVFEPFFTTKATGKGTGLGLSMVYGFVKQSGGHIKIYSEEGHGTTIKIYLPRASGQALLVTDGAQARVGGGHESILVVEDDAMVRNYVVAQLGSLGYRTLTAKDATEALAIVDSPTELDLLFTDVIMPGAMNGRQLADEAVKRRPPLKVLFTSGYTENAIVHHGRLDPGVLLLAKPYRKSDLARMVRKAFEAAQAAPDAPSFVEHESSSQNRYSPRIKRSG
jgi:PAS domain S-box-containing protein